MANPIRIAFVTGHRFGVAALSGILASKSFLQGELELVGSIGLDPLRASRTVGFASARELVASYAPHIETLDGTLRENENTLSDWHPDVVFVVGWSSLVPASVLEVAAGVPAVVGDHEVNLRGIGMHPTALPVGRGQAPIPWTIIKGLRTTALSVFELEERADSGAVFARYPLQVSATADAGLLFEKFVKLHERAGRDIAEALALRSVRGQVQDESIASIWPKRRPSDGVLRPDMTRSEVDAMVRALMPPYPCARVDHRGVVRSVVGTDFRAPLDDGRQREPAEFLAADGEIRLALGSIVDTQPG